ncbi:hypothetical protein [Bacteroides congonensis]
MKSKLLFMLLSFFFFMSCSTDILVNENENNISIPNFIKDINGKVVEEIPYEVYYKFAEDLVKDKKLESLNVLQSSFYDDGNKFTLKEDLKKLTFNAPQTRGSIYTLRYRSHLRTQGWTEFVNEGEITGTVGQKRQMEALLFSTNAPGFIAQAHVETDGWLSLKTSGQVVGTVGENKRLEAIKIQIDKSAGYAYYRVHMQDYGWGPYVSNMEIAGTIGEHKRIEAFTMYLLIP